jgi:hypothetical protein
LLDACQEQKEVSTELRALALALSSQLSAEKIVQRIESLVLRQSANERAADRVHETFNPFARFDGTQNTSQDRVDAEQRAIERDTAQLADALDETASPSANDKDGAMLRALPASLSTPQISLSAGIPHSALKATLLELLAKWKARENADTRLDQARAQVEALLRDQKSLASETAHHPEKNDALAERQAVIADQAELTHDIHSLNVSAAGEMDQAQTGMQQNTGTLASAGHAADSLPTQTSVIARLAHAAELLTQDAKARDVRENETPPELTKDLQQLKDQIDHASQSNHNQPDPVLAARVSEMQKQAAVIAPQAASPLAAAAGQLQQAQSAAAPELAAASQSVQQQLNAIAQPARDFAALAKAAAAIKEAMQKAHEADNSLKRPAHSDAARVTGNLAAAQNDVAQADGAIGKLSESAHQALQQAASEFGKGGAASVQNNRSDAQQHTEAGMQVLSAAGQHLAQAMQDVRAAGMAAAGIGTTPGMPGGREPGPRGRATQGQLAGMDAPGQPEGLLEGGHELMPSTGPVVGTLSPKDRDALIQYQAEKTPPEYAPMVQQYMKNLSDSSTP